MVEPLRHRQTKAAAIDVPGLLRPRHIPTLPKPPIFSSNAKVAFGAVLYGSMPGTERMASRFPRRHHQLATQPVRVEDMLSTPMCDLLGIDLPIILARMGAGATSAEFAAVASNVGGLGSVGSLFRAADAMKRDIDLLPTLTNRNFAINHIPQALDADAFRHTLQARPAVISFALDGPGDLIPRLMMPGLSSWCRSRRSVRPSRQPIAVSM
jgi:hypothetical protein